jgi:hypothetical protein
MAQANNSLSQPFFSENSPAMLELEGMVDRVGMANVLYALAHIALAKADHLETNWQDRASAYLWRVGAGKLDRFAARSNTAFHPSVRANLIANSPDQN